MKWLRKWLLNRAIERVEREGFVILESSQEIQDLALSAWDYVHRSGHLHRVDGSKPKAVRRLREYLAAIYVAAGGEPVEEEQADVPA